MINKEKILKLIDPARFQVIELEDRVTVTNNNFKVIIKFDGTMEFSTKSAPIQNFKMLERELKEVERLFCLVKNIS